MFKLFKQEAGNGDTAKARALKSLLGLTVGDQFGEMFFVADFEQLVEARSVPAGQWHYTDDTEMALSVVAILAQHGQIKQHALMAAFARHHDMYRGYGPSMRRVLEDVRAGQDWQSVVASTFAGQGSYGNGSAMRVGPLGAFFAQDLPRCVEQAKLSSLTTHTHPEALAGAVAVAIAAALAWRSLSEGPVSPAEFIANVASWVPESEVQSRLVRAAHLPADMASATAAAILGNGHQISAQDTVPFAVWCAAHHLNDYAEALWTAISVGGDRDTIGAMVGSIVALSSRTEIPSEWLSAAEAYPDWFAVS